jgi:endoglycosylceramidase
LDQLEEVVSWAGDSGIYIILDMHQDLYSRKFGGDGAPEWAVRDEGLPFLILEENSEGDIGADLWYLNYSTPAVMKTFDNFYENRDGIRDHFIEAWRRVAERFKGNPVVIGYDLLNEPFPGSRLTELDNFDRSYLQPFYEKLIEAMLDADSGHLFFFEPNAMRTNVYAGSGFPSGFTSFSITEEFLVFAPHFYDPEVTVTLEYDGNISRLDATLESILKEGPRLGVPVWVGEWAVWGGAVENGEGLLADQLEVFDRYLVGFSYWNYSRNPEDKSSPVNSSWMLDILVRPQPSFIAGIPEFLYYDSDAGKVEFRFREEEAGLFTEILVPARFCRPEECLLEVEPDRSCFWEEGKSPGVSLLKIQSASESESIAVYISRGSPEAG